MPDFAEILPSPEEYVALRAACGLGPRSVEAARTGLPNSLFGLTVRKDGLLIAMGRVVGDGGCFAELVDIAVHPDHRGNGLGEEIVRRLVATARARLPATCYVSLISAPRAASLYARHGFEREIGMGQHIPDRL